MLIGIALTVAYVILLLGAAANLRENPTRPWLAAYLFTSTILSVLFGLTSPDRNLGLPIALLYIVNSALLGAVTFRYQRLPFSVGWPIAGALTALAVFGVAQFEPGGALSRNQWLAAILSEQPSYAALVGAVVYLLGGLVQEMFTLVALRMAVLPLHANRSLFWGLALPVVVMGEILAAWGQGPLQPVGQTVRWLGVAGLTYAVVARRLVDVRGVVRQGLGHLVFLALATLLVLLGITLAETVRPAVTGAEGLATLFVVALAIGLLYQILRAGAATLVKQIILNSGYETTAIVRQFSQRVTSSLDVFEITQAADEVFKQVLDARRSMLLLTAPQEGRVVARPFFPDGQLTVKPVTLAADSPLTGNLKRQRCPLLQYDIDEDPLYEALDPREKRWLHNLQMDVYVPAREGDELIGFFAVGPRASGDPYRAPELELMTTVAEQSSVALKNARLFGDLRALNEEMLRLNESLRETNETLASMDQVKTDFITIASHELRTPLTQLRGYADVLGTMIDMQALKPETMKNIVESIKRASDRLNAVYGQMLDVSQIDVNAMDLKLVDTTLDAILRLAVEPYAPAMRERKQTLTAQGVKNIPPIRGDFQRLVQAFSHVIGNAMKFTPDGGRIDIGARLIAPENGQPQSVEVVIADKGVGIDPKYQELIFQKFFRVGSTALHSTSTTAFMGAGPGLGLPIAKGIVEGHGGRIWVESEGHDPAKLPGTRVHVRLPLSPPAFDPRALKEKPEPMAEQRVIRPFG